MEHWTTVCEDVELWTESPLLPHLKHADHVPAGTYLWLPSLPARLVCYYIDLVQSPAQLPQQALYCLLNTVLVDIAVSMEVCIVPLISSPLVVST